MSLPPFRTGTAATTPRRGLPGYPGRLAGTARSDGFGEKDALSRGVYEGVRVDTSGERQEGRRDRRGEYGQSSERVF